MSDLTDLGMTPTDSSDGWGTDHAMQLWAIHAVLRRYRVWVESVRVAGPGVSFDPVDDLPNPA